MADRTPASKARHWHSRLAPLMRFWPVAKRILTLAFLALVAWLLIKHAQNIDWAEVRSSLAGYAWPTIAVSLVLATGAYLAYASYDLFGRYYTGHGIPRRNTMAIAFVCCAFTLNLGAIIGSIGFRYRMYSRRGVSKGDITHVVGMTITTNWLGYVLLLGLVLVSGYAPIPFGWDISPWLLRGAGALCLALVGAYFLLCRFARTRSRELWGQTVTLPSLRVAVAQLAVASAHWLLMGAVIFSLLDARVGYFTLLGVLLMSSIAGILSHIPGALGVLEAVFLSLLADEVGSAPLLAALIAYRAVFYLWPLFVALALYGLLEMTANKDRRQTARADSSSPSRGR